MDQNFGASLREARERKGVSLRKIAADTKIPVATLESLERNDFSKLPGGIFSRAFVRSYAIEVGLDPDETVHRFLRQFEGEEAADETAGGQPSAHAETAGRQASALEFTAEFEFESKQRMAAVVLKLVVASIPIAAAILYFTSRGSTPALPAQTQAPPDRPVVEQAVRAEPPAPASVPAVAPESKPAPQPAREDSASITIEIAPTADCWAKLTADGSVVVSRVLKAGERETRTFRDAALLQVGDAEACAILINGRPARPLGPARRVRQVRITRDNYTAFLP